MAKFSLHTMIVVPHLDKGGVIVAIDNPGTGPVYTVDFGYGETGTYPESELSTQGR
jgi:hypothetical protein